MFCIKKGKLYNHSVPREVSHIFHIYIYISSREVPVIMCKCNRWFDWLWTCNRWFDWL